jgi:hypothetical protein
MEQTLARRLSEMLQEAPLSGRVRPPSLRTGTTSIGEIQVGYGEGPGSRQTWKRRDCEDMR